MRKLVLIAAMCAAVAAGSARAAGPEHLTFAVQDSFIAPFLSDVCGVPVRITLDGVSHVTLWRSGAGLVVRERDSLSSFTATFDSPVSLGGTGRSFTTHSPGVVTYDYGNGAAIGSTAVVTITGLDGTAAGPGSLVSAGYQRLTGTVFAFSPEGIPIVDWDGPIETAHGHWPAFEAVLAQRCDALGGSLQP